MYVSLKMRIPHYARQRIINLGNSREIQGNSGEIRRKAFHLFTRFAQYIPLSGKSNSPDFSSGYRENSCEKNSHQLMAGPLSRNEKKMTPTNTMSFFFKWLRRPFCF